MTFPSWMLSSRSFDNATVLNPWTTTITLNHSQDDASTKIVCCILYNSYQYSFLKASEFVQPLIWCPENTTLPLCALFKITFPANTHLLFGVSDMEPSICILALENFIVPFKINNGIINHLIDLMREEERAIQRCGKEQNIGNMSRGRCSWGQHFHSDQKKWWRDKTMAGQRAP